jgi:SAM-dependent methyltransferase
MCSAWAAVFREFRRVLAPGGAVVFSTYHPFMDWQLDGVANYFGTRQITETWRKGTGEYEVAFWRRPLSVMVEEIRAGGFAVDDLAEPAPLRELESISPSDYRTLMTKPRFLFFRLRPR